MGKPVRVFFCLSSKLIVKNNNITWSHPPDLFYLIVALVEKWLDPLGFSTPLKRDQPVTPTQKYIRQFGLISKLELSSSVSFQAGVFKLFCNRRETMLLKQPPPHIPRNIKKLMRYGITK